MDESKRKSHVAVFSGGTAFNDTAVALLAHPELQVSHILPVSDNGGSSAEVSRVIGGPALGDIRSRLITLASEATEQDRAVKTLLKYRLPTGDDDSVARLEWSRILEGTHPLWEDITPACKSTIRAFLLHFQHEVMTASDNTRFDFRQGSIGNFFFNGARTFFRSVEAAIFWFSGVTSQPGRLAVVPVIHTNSRVNIAAELADGTCIHGQQEISHPPAVKANGCTTEVDKQSWTPLSAPISRIFYSNEDQQETFPPGNPTMFQILSQASHVVYAQGSLYTSIVPCLVVNGVGAAVSAVPGRRILVLNASHDRETQGMTATDFVRAIHRSLWRHRHTKVPLKQSVDTLIVAKGGSIPIDTKELRKLGIRVVEVDTKYKVAGNPQSLVYDDTALAASLAQQCAPQNTSHGHSS